MTKNTSKKNMVENEVVFRKVNERVLKNIDMINIEAKDDPRGPVGFEDDVELHFYCECSDEKCKDRLKMNQDAYRKIHKNRSRFIVALEHNSDKVEKVIRKTKTYMVVEKFELPSEKAHSLKHTSLDNSGK